MSDNIASIFSLYDVDETNGFLPGSEPLTRLPEAFTVWEELADREPELLQAKKLRDAVNKLSYVDPTSLNGDVRCCGLVWETVADLDDFPDLASFSLFLFGSAFPAQSWQNFV